MEQYIVSARKYRPSTFASVVGQQALTATLKNAIATQRLAHAYLFCGSRGVGKTSCARIFAKTINCTNLTPDGEACNECDSCRQFNENRSLNIIELDAASNNGVDHIRDLIDQVVVPPAVGRYRVFIVDEVHMLSSQAFNAFLKTLEEPPEHAIFILATTEKHKIIPTILSRCQIFDFNRITINDMVEHMMKVAAQEGYTADPAALNVIAQKADGAMRDALSIFDQVAASTRGNITYEATIANLNVLDHSYYVRLLDAITGGDVATALLIYSEIRAKGFDSQFFINGLASYFRDLAVASSPSTLHLVEATDAVRAEMAERASKLHPTFLYRAMELCNAADFNYRQATNKQFLIELTLIKLCQLLSPSSVDSGGDEGQLKPLESGKEAAPRTATVQPTPQTVRTAPAAVAQEPVRTYSAPARPATPPPAPAVRTATAGPGGISLAALRSGTVQTPVKDEAPAVVQRQNRATPFTDADFGRVWAQSVAAAAQGPMITTILSANVPVRAEGDNFVVKVSSDVEAEVLAKAIPAVQRMVRDALQNDAFALSTEVCATELPKNLWTDDRVLADILEEHPAMKHLMEKFQLRRT